MSFYKTTNIFTYKFYYIFQLVFLLSLCCIDIFAQSEFPQNAAEKFSIYQSARPQEKVYLHLDKPYSAIGDTIWFKAYIVEANRQFIDTISKVLYVDLINEKLNNITISHRYPLINGNTNGRFVVTDSIKAGQYRIRAYTNYMRNFSEDFFFNQKIQIYDDGPSYSEADTNKIDLQFFAEGGNLIAGLPNRVAFKAIDIRGYGTDIEGLVISSAGDTITSLASTHLGMGNFNITPEPNKTYMAQVRRQKGDWKSFVLPKVNTDGYALQVDNISNKNNVRVIISVNKSLKAEDKATLIATGKGEVSFASTVPLTRKTIVVNIPRNQLAEGISQITLFDENQVPTCERLVWANKPTPLNISLKTNKPKYNSRELIDVSMSVLDFSGKPIVGSFSMAAVDTRNNGYNQYDQNIVSYMALSSELKGFIERPAFYFDSTQADAKFKLDLLLMTQGWRRFAWKEILKFDSTMAPKYYIETGLSLKGNVTKLNGKSPGLVNLTTVMRQNDGQTIFKADSDEKGNFVFNDLNFYDSTSFTIQAETPKGNKELTINLYPIGEQKVKPISGDWPTEQFQSNLLAYIRQMADHKRLETNANKTLDEVVIKAKKIKEKDPRKNYSAPSNTLNTAEIASSGALNIIEAIQSRIPGVSVTGSGLNVKVNIRGAANFSGAIDPLYILDGLPTDLQQLTSISVNDVESVDVLKGAQASAYGSRGAGGVLCVYTKRGNKNYDWTKDKTPGMKGSKIMGFEVERTFYSPKYEVAKAIDKPDLRSTLYWNPAIKTDKEGKAKISFYNNDSSSSNILIRAEGLANDGVAGAALWYSEK